MVPFSKLTPEDEQEICNQEFFEKYIKTGAFVLFKRTMHRTENFFLKGDGSFRDASLVSPVLYLVLQAIGKEISCKYVSQRHENIEVYYAGNFDHMRPKYKQDYDDFFKSLNASIEDYQYFIKTDLSNFFGNINVDKLIFQIDSVCNASAVNISQTQLQLYKELLLYAGQGRFPLVENSVASSYLATIIYLDIIDQKLYKFIADNIPDISEFKLVRYVDDLYILIKSDKPVGHLHSAYNEIRNEYSSILKDYGLALNTKKCCIKPSRDINIELKKSLYDEKFNGEKHSIESLFNGSLLLFLKDLSLELLFDSIDVERYNELIEEHFNHPDIEFTASEVFNYFVYENTEELAQPEVATEIAGLVEQDISFISLDPKRLTVMITRTRDEHAIKMVLNQLLNRDRNEKWNSYDTTTAISYLIQRGFRHRDLINALETNCPGLYRYYTFYCDASFINCFRPAGTNTYIEVINEDWKTYYLYFMYCIEKYKHNNLGSFAFFKNYFDRITAHLAFQTKFEPDLKKPNYKNFYKDKTLKKFYAGIPDSDTVIQKAHDLRNANPIAHSSAGLIDRNDTTEELSKSISDLKRLIKEFCKRNKL